MLFLCNELAVQWASVSWPSHPGLGEDIFAGSLAADEAIHKCSATAIPTRSQTRLFHFLAPFTMIIRASVLARGTLSSA